jgi:hypothetical protein
MSSFPPLSWVVIMFVYMCMECHSIDLSLQTQQSESIDYYILVSIVSNEFHHAYHKNIDDSLSGKTKLVKDT